jgi:hypothetical protein
MSRITAVLATLLLAACVSRGGTPPAAAEPLDTEAYFRAGTLAGVAELPACAPLPVPRPEWERRDEGPFSLRLPRGYRKKNARGIDSFVGRYDAPGRNLIYDFGLYSSTLDEWRTDSREFYACRDSVGPHLVKFVTARAANGSYRAGATWRELARGELGSLHLTVSTESRSAAHQQEALAIFRSVQFRGLGNEARNEPAEPL